MKFGPKYKRARFLGAPIFEKTQTEKYKIRESKKLKSKKRGKGKTDYGLKVLEKQKARIGYGLTEEQFSRYIAKAMDRKGDTGKHLLESLESRLDNAVLRTGLAKSRRLARQMVSHGHILVNGKKVTIPSYHVEIGDKIAIREGSKKSALWNDFAERSKTHKMPSWIKGDVETRVFEIQAAPSIEQSELLFDVPTVLEYYTR